MDWTMENWKSTCELPTGGKCTVASLSLNFFHLKKLYCNVVSFPFFLLFLSLSLYTTLSSFIPPSLTWWPVAPVTQDSLSSRSRTRLSWLMNFILIVWLRKSDHVCYSPCSVLRSWFLLTISLLFCMYYYYGYYSHSHYFFIILHLCYVFGTLVLSSPLATLTFG